MICPVRPPERAHHTNEREKYDGLAAEWNFARSTLNERIEKARKHRFEWQSGR
jgi:hypothetical protein